MKISARVENSFANHSVTLLADGHEHTLVMSPRTDGFGSSVNGGELLFLALATCNCNDLYCEARKRNIELKSVRVEVNGEFGKEGEAAKKISYSAAIEGSAPTSDLLDLLRVTDSVAEIQNTLRSSVPVALEHCEAITV